MKKGLDSLYNLIESLEMLPTIGKKSARNIALYMVREDNFAALKIAHAIEEAVSTVKSCSRCGGLSEHELCEVCSDDGRDHTVLCLYFVFESIEHTDIEKLRSMVEDGVREVIFAFPPSIQNDALIYYIEEKLSGFEIAFTKIAQGVPTGVNLENVDSLSLSRAIESRVKI